MPWPEDITTWRQCRWSRYGCTIPTLSDSPTPGSYVKETSTLGTADPSSIGKRSRCVCVIITYQIITPWDNLIFLSLTMVTTHLMQPRGSVLAIFSRRASLTLERNNRVEIFHLKGEWMENDVRTASQHPEKFRRSPPTEKKGERKHLSSKRYLSAS